MDRVTILDDGKLEYHHDDALMNRILNTVFPPYPRYDRITVPQLAIVPNGDFHPSAPPDAPEALCRAADEFWLAVLRPWIRLRTTTFQASAPAAKVVTINTPFHHILHAKEDKTVRVMVDFLTSIVTDTN
jgi:hypothetical protein